MAPSKLKIFNNALRLMGEPRIENIDAASPSRLYVAEMVDAFDDIVGEVFEDHLWYFATTSVQLSAVTALDGWSYAFNQPANFAQLIRIVGTNEYDAREIDYEYRDQKFLTERETTYCFYISNATISTIGNWPQTFANLIAARLADEVYPSTDESNSTRNRIESAVKRRSRAAKTADAFKKPRQKPPVGNYVLARSRSIGTGARYRQ